MNDDAYNKKKEESLHCKFPEIPFSFDSVFFFSLLYLIFRSEISH